jgi:beta-lactamase class A
MISQSDNTATDHLIDRLGREAVEESFASMGHSHPELNTPLLMTREWFAIKMRFSDRDIHRYELAGEATRREIIQEMAIPNAATLAEWEPWLAFRAIDTIEWFASATDLCTAMASLLETARHEGMQPVLDALSLQPGITFDPAVWSYVGYKGGYETGVKSDVWLLQRVDGRWFVMAGIINNIQAEIDGYGFTDLMIAAADLLARTE